MNDLEQIRKKFIEGDRIGARKDLIALIKTDAKDIEGWMLLAELVDEPERKRECYQRVLQIDADHPGARAGLASLEPSWEAVMPAVVERPAPAVETSKPAPVESPASAIEAPAPAAEEPPAQRRIDTKPVDLHQISKLRSDMIQKQPLGGRIADALNRFINRLIPAERPRRGEFLAVLFILILAGALIWVGFGLPLPGGTNLLNLVARGPLSPNQPIGAVATPTDAPEPTATVVIKNELRVYYAQETSLYCWRGEDVTLLQNFENQIRQAALSPDRSLTALTADQALWLVDCARAEMSALVTADQIVPAQADPRFEGSRYTPRSLAWSPDSRFIYFDTISTSDQGTYATNDLFVVEVSSGTVRPLLPYDQGGRPSISPDGKWVATVGDKAISLVSSDGSSLVRVLEFPEQPALAWNPGGELPVAWLPDGSAFITVVSMKDNSSAEFGRAFTVFRVSVPDGAAQELRLIPALEGAYSLSPDGKYVIYKSEGVEGARFVSLRLAETGGEKDEPLAQGQAIQLAGWMPHPGGFAYVLETDRQLYSTEAFGKEGIPLLTGEALPLPLLKMFWLDEEHYLLLTGLGVYSGATGQPLKAILPGDPGSTRILGAGYQPYTP
jgi:hypothetical protein